MPADAPRRPYEETTLHASCIAAHGGGALIRGVSGSGKSGLALQLISLGATLVSDDRTRLWRDGAVLIADAPAAIRGKIEARGVGILSAAPAGPSPVTLVVDMDRAETERLPPVRDICLMGVHLPVMRKQETLHFPAAIMLYLQSGRLA